MSKSAIERLEMLLNEQDARIEKLEQENEELERRVEGAKAGWSLPRSVEDARPELPLPRLEMEWLPRSPGDWGAYKVEYRLVYRHLCDHVVVIPLGLTRVEGGGQSPFARGADAEKALPFRDGAHIIHDSAHLALPAYALTPDGPVRLDLSTTGLTNARDRGKKHRREAP